MHPSALENAKCFFDVYSESIRNTTQTVKVVEIGSLDVNGSIRDHAPKDFEYIGVDFSSGKGVDVILDDPYKLPFQNESVDIVVTSSCFEHSELFWVLFIEILRIIKPTGLFYLNAPSNGEFHRWPVDCWRFYPDSGLALQKWANLNSIDSVLLESYTSKQLNDQWNDFVGVFAKSKENIIKFPDRILDVKNDFYNGITHGNNFFKNHSTFTEDGLKIRNLQFPFK